MKKSYEEKIKVFISFIIISPNSKTAEWRYIFLKGDKIMKNYLMKKSPFCFILLSMTCILAN